MRLLTLAIAYLLFCDGILCRHAVNEDEVVSPIQATQYQRPPHKKESSINHKNFTTTTTTFTPKSSATGLSHKHADPLDVLNNIFSILFSPSSTSTTSNVISSSASLSTAPHHISVHRATETKSVSQHHTAYISEPTTHIKDSYSTASHAVHTTMITKSKSTVTEDHTNPSRKQKNLHVKSNHYKGKTKHDNDSDDDDDDNDSDDDNNDGDGGGKRTSTSSSIRPSFTMLSALPSLTATAPDPKKSQIESEMVAAERTNKIIGIVVGLGCVAIGSAGLIGYILSRRQDRRQEQLLADGSVQTRWRPQSFLAVVSTAVNRIQHNCSRDSSFKHNATNTNQGMPTSMQTVEHGYAV
ncbi:hypothetical protein INT43_006600 [Umbelopsis isabellina]|uniref:Mid2 domain-containing protein n=1 Tax=Mortierella isabellina TaxID=91625 RepID=A0A8H7ULW2_MORIS|nr:hypothetical protein INT43_006600 [Umbelopsis isabellina]